MSVAAEEVHALRLKVPGGVLEGELRRPAGALGTVIFAHGSGSSRLSVRNRAVARGLRRRGLATLLMDLLTEDEALDRALVFDVQLLARRLDLAAAWVADQEGCDGLPLGVFGASTGAAAALTAAARRAERFQAVVSRGGRPDLALDLGLVRAPTLLIVGGADNVVLTLNREALLALRCEKSLAVVPGATHLFEEPGALEEVTALASDWFGRHLRPAAAAQP
jgi:putative phosphoribosyl transferase